MRVRKVDWFGVEEEKRRWGLRGVEVLASERGCRIRGMKRRR
jgi:hypothetical protein